MWKVLVKDSANRFLFQNANLLGIFIHNGRSHYRAPALKKGSRQTNEYQSTDTRTIDLNMKRHLTKSQSCLYFSLQCRRFLRVCESFCSRKRHVVTPEERRKWGESKGAGRRRKEREEKITFAQPKHRTLQSIIYSPEKQKTYWNKQHFGMR